MKKIYAVLLLLYIKLAFSQEPSFISHISQKLVKDIGDEAELVCSTKYSREFNVSWFKVVKDPIDASIVLSSGSTLIAKDPRVTLIIDMKQDSSQYIIHINDIQEGDDSIYRCDVITGNNDKITYYTQLLVGNQPFIYENSSRSIVVKEFQSVQLACFAGGYPTPRVFWRKPNKAILSMGNILKIPTIKKEDRGNYYCIAKNGVRNDTSRKISISVEFSPVITALQTRVGQAVYYDAFLECHVEANPEPAITWIFNGEELFNNQHYLISDSVTADNKTDSLLRIMNINNYLYGDYICRATNNLGAAEKKINVYETLLPQCPPACEY